MLHVVASQGVFHELSLFKPLLAVWVEALLVFFLQLFHGQFRVTTRASLDPARLLWSAARVDIGCDGLQRLLQEILEVFWSLRTS